MIKCKLCDKEMFGLEAMPVAGIDPTICWDCLKHADCCGLEKV
jgi:hypothetical protein